MSEEVVARNVLRRKNEGINVGTYPGSERSEQGAVVWVRKIGELIPGP